MKLRINAQCVGQTNTGGRMKVKMESVKISSVIFVRLIFAQIGFGATDFGGI